MRKLVYHRLAKQDLILIRKYTVKNWGKDQATKYLNELRQAIQLIKQNPRLGVRKRDIQDSAYSLVYKSDMIYYQFDKHKIVITGVFHQSMLPKKHLQGRIM